MGTAHQKRQRLLWQDDEERGESNLRRMPLRAGSGRGYSLQICGQPQNRGAVTGERGQMAASLSSYFIPLPP